MRSKPEEKKLEKRSQARLKNSITLGPYQLNKQQKALRNLHIEQKKPTYFTDNTNDSCLTDSDELSGSTTHDEDDEGTTHRSARKCLPNTRAELDEGGCKKSEEESRAVELATKEERLMTLLRMATKFLPSTVSSKTHQKKPTQIPATRYKLHGISRELVNLQLEINEITLGLRKEKFLQSFSFLDELRPVLTKRSCVILGEFNETESSGGSPLRRSSLPPKTPNLGTVWKGFWLNVLEQCITTGLMICPWDRMVLEYLVDIRCSNFKDPLAFTLDFLFTENPFFTNASLTRQFEYSDFTPHCCSGTKISWLDHSNITLTNSGKPKRSFFNFFAPIVTSKNQIVGSDKDAHLAKTSFKHDFKIGNLIRSKLIPWAYSYFVLDADDCDNLCSSDDPRRHPVRRSVELDPNVCLSMEELEKIEADFLKEDDSKFKTLQTSKEELNQHVRMALKRLGYRIRKGRAYSQGDVTTSGESLSESLVEADEEDAEVIIQKNFRGLLETNTLKKQRQHFGVKLDELRRVAETEMSGDDIADLLDLQSESDESYDSEASLYAGRRIYGKRIVQRKKNRQSTGSIKKRNVR